MVLEEVPNSKSHHQPHLMTFLVQNPVLNKKLLNSFFVLIMYFFSPWSFQSRLWFSFAKHQHQHPCKKQPSSSAQNSENQ